ncbi:hypothetical protein HHA02_03220 [Cobetia marina]|nr:hypothetical protein HHA02_03220 [Cobetia marina]
MQNMGRAAVADLSMTCTEKPAIVCSGTAQGKSCLISRAASMGRIAGAAWLDARGMVRGAWREGHACFDQHAGAFTQKAPPWRSLRERVAIRCHSRCEHHLVPLIVFGIQTLITDPVVQA